MGGESGPGARPIEAAWVRNIRTECRALNIPFFFKQWGGVRKAKAGRLLDGRTFDEFPDMPQNEVATANERELLLSSVGAL